jgi:hypothetical protein
VKQKHDGQIEVLSIDRKKGLRGIYLVGDNLKFLKSLPLEKFDVIDLDAYGVPFRQLDYILDYDQRKGVGHYFFVTFVQSMSGRLPNLLLRKIGYSKEMVRKIPTLFCRDGFKKFRNYLSMMGIEKIIFKNHGRKYYLFFET